MFRCSTVASIVLFFLCNALAQNVLQKGKDIFYLKERVSSHCNFSYVDDFIYDINLRVDKKECSHGDCTFELSGLYNRLPPKKGCLESSLAEVGLKYNKKNFIPICDFVKCSKPSNMEKTGMLSFLHEGLCLYKVADKINFVKNDYKYRFGVMKIIKDSTNSLVVEDRNGEYCNQGECEMDLVFHSCDVKRCRFSIAQRGGLYNSSSKVSIYPLCDFVEIKRDFNSETMSLGTISATKSGLCELRMLNKFGSYKISIEIPNDLRDMPLHSKSWKE